MRLNRKIRSLLIVSLIVLIVGLVIAYFYNTPTPAHAETVPVPNGYDDFVAAGKLVQGDMPDWHTTTLQDIKTFLSENQEAIQRAHAGLAKECATPTEYTTAYMERHGPDLPALKRIAVALYLEGKLAQMEGRPADAAQIWAAVIKMGSDTAQQGLLIDGLVSIAIQAIGVQNFQGLVSSLDAEQCRKTIAKLEKIDDSQAAINGIFSREKTYMKSAPFMMYVSALMQAKSLDPTKPYKAKSQAKFDTQKQKLLRLKTALAARAYELEKGGKPDKWSDLAPAYLKTIPVDSGTGAALPFGF